MPAGSFARNVTTLTVGTVAAQGIAALSLPLLTRLYSPEDFGLLAAYTAVLSVLSVIACLRYEIAIPLPDSDTDGLALLVGAILSAGFVAALCLVPALFFPVQAARLIGQPGLAPYLWLVPAGVFATAVYNALQYWASRKSRFPLIARTRVSRALGGSVVQLALGVIAPRAVWLILGQIVQSGAGIGPLARAIWRSDKNTIRKLTPAKVYWQLRSQRRFPIFSVPEALFNTAGVQVPVLAIGAIAGQHEIGYLYLGMRVMGLPIGIVGRSVAQVFVAEAPARARAGTLRRYVWKNIWTLFRVGAPPAIALGLSAPWMFSSLFGADWNRAGFLTALMTPWFLLQFMVSPVSMALHVVGKQSLACILQAGGVILRVGVVLIVAWTGVHGVSEAFAISSAAFYATYLLIVMRSV
ncbi:lipopolysaccharide biosynthesis protein [Deferrisoma sp.]